MFAAAAVVVLLATASLADAACTDHTDCLACYGAASAGCAWCVGMISKDVGGVISHHDIRVGKCVDAAVSGAPVDADCDGITFGSLLGAFAYTSTEPQLDTSFVLKPYSEDLHNDDAFSAQCEAYPMPAHTTDGSGDTCEKCLALADARWCQSGLALDGAVEIATSGGGVCTNIQLTGEGTDQDLNLCQDEALWPTTEPGVADVMVKAEIINPTGGCQSISVSSTSTVPPTDPPTDPPTTDPPTTDPPTTDPPTTDPPTTDPPTTDTPTTVSTNGGADRAIVMVGPLAFAAVAAVLAL